MLLATKKENKTPTKTTRDLTIDVKRDILLIIHRIKVRIATDNAIL